MDITKKDFEILHWIHYMQINSPKQLCQQMDIAEKEAEIKLKKFEKEGLIEIEYRENEIYGSRLTEKGENIWKDSQYDKWKEELGY